MLDDGSRIVIYETHESGGDWPACAYEWRRIHRRGVDPLGAPDHPRPADGDTWHGGPTLATFGLWSTQTASTDRNRQLDAMLTMLDERTATLITGMQTATLGLETVIEQTRKEGTA